MIDGRHGVDLTHPLDVVNLMLPSSCSLSINQINRASIHVCRLRKQQMLQGSSGSNVLLLLDLQGGSVSRRLVH